MSEIEDKHSPKTAMTDDEMVEVHTELNHTKHPPTKGFLQAPSFSYLFLVVLFSYAPSSLPIHKSIPTASASGSS